MFDIDGVLYKGGTVLEDSFRFLQYLRESGKRIYFITNNSTRTRE